MYISTSLRFKTSRQFCLVLFGLMSTVGEIKDLCGLNVSLSREVPLWLTGFRTQLASVGGLRILRCHEGWCRWHMQLGWLWLWGRLGATAPIWPLDKELPCVASTALKSRKKKKRISALNLNKIFPYLRCITQGWFSSPGQRIWCYYNRIHYHTILVLPPHKSSNCQKVYACKTRRRNPQTL